MNDRNTNALTTMGDELGLPGVAGGLYWLAKRVPAYGRSLMRAAAGGPMAGLMTGAQVMQPTPANQGEQSFYKTDPATGRMVLNEANPIVAAKMRGQNVFTPNATPAMPQMAPAFPQPRPQMGAVDPEAYGYGGQRPQQPTAQPAQPGQVPLPQPAPGQNVPLPQPRPFAAGGAPVQTASATPSPFYGAGFGAGENGNMSPANMGQGSNVANNLLMRNILAKMFG